MTEFMDIGFDILLDPHVFELSIYIVESKDEIESDISPNPCVFRFTV